MGLGCGTDKKGGIENGFAEDATKANKRNIVEMDVA
jgi:hypothetical protein